MHSHFFKSDWRGGNAQETIGSACHLVGTLGSSKNQQKKVRESDIIMQIEIVPEG